MLISIVISTYNRCKILEEMLESLLQLDNSDNYIWEVIVVDNNSSDQTKDVVEHYIKKFNGKLKYTFEPQQGLNYARNRGLKEAQGDIITFTDDDVEVHHDWLENIWVCFSQQDCDAVGGRVLPVYPQETPQWVRDCQSFIDGTVLCHDYGENTMLYNRETMVPQQ